MVAAANAIVQEFAEMLSAIATAAADNAISTEEAFVIRQRWQKLKSATEEFVHCGESGNFTSVAGPSAPGEES